MLRSAGLWRALLHRSRSDWPVVLAAGLLLLCATVLLAAGAVYGDVVALGGLRQAILDALSLRQNWEMQLRIADPTVADRFARALFDRDVEIASPARMPSGLKERAVNALMSAISPVL